jgi:hypothetical protein
MGPLATDGGSVREAGVYVAGDDAVWIMVGGTANHFDGESWSSVAVPTAAPMSGAWGTGPRDIWVASEVGSIHHFDGVSWAPVAPNIDDTFHRVSGSRAGDIWFASRLGSVLRLLVTMPTLKGGACAEPLRAFCNVSLRGHTMATQDGPADCGAGDHAGGELAYKIEVPVTGRLTARVTSRHDVDLVALGADARGGCDVDACVSEGAGTEVELEVRQGDVYYLVVGARDGAAPFTLDVACEKN